MGCDAHTLHEQTNKQKVIFMMKAKHSGYGWEEGNAQFLVDSFIPWTFNHRYTEINWCVRQKKMLRVPGTDGTDIP